MDNELIVSQSEEALEKLRRIRNDPIEFCKGVFTLDEAEKVNSPVKRFPIHLAYIRLYIRVWQKTPLLLIPKSRRMKMSWTNIVLYVWDTMFHQGRHNAFVSKKEDDANYLIKERAIFIIKNLDPKIIPIELLPKYELTYNLLVFPEIHSRIQGFPQGADQMRQYTISGILADEFAFWGQAKKMYSASKPTLEGGGRFTGVSSPGPGFFKQLVFDKINTLAAITGTVDLMSQREVKRPMIGVQIWANSENGFTVFQLHYTADARKRTVEWRNKEMKGMPVKEWNQEYELMWDSYSGTPVYTDYNTVLHGSEERLYPHIGLPILRGWDFGLMPACIFGQLQEDTLVIFAEFTRENMGAERFSEIVLKQSQLMYPSWSDKKADWIDCVDPSGFFKKDTDEVTCAQILQGKGLQVRPGAVVWEKRRKSVEDYLTKIVGGRACFKVDLAACPTLVLGFEGGYRYPDKALELEKSKIIPEKDVHSHPHDALQMITTCIKILLNARRRNIPRPSYGRR